MLVPPAGRRRAAQLLSSGRITATWGDAPSPDAIRQLDQERFLQSAILTEPASEDDLASAKALLAHRSAEELTAALVRLYRAQLPAAEDLADPGGANDRKGARFDARPKREKPDARFPRDDRTESRGESRARGPMKSVWFRLDVGRQKNADPKWLVPMICRKGKITKQDIGAIRIFDDETKFEIGEHAAERFTQAVRNAPHGDGQIEPSSPPGDMGSARRHAPRKDRPDAPKSGYGESKTSEAKSGDAPARPEKRGGKGKGNFGDRPPFRGKGGFGGASPKGKPRHKKARET
jgi:ATP-dependent RNA helicase DeaD